MAPHCPYETIANKTASQQLSFGSCSPTVGCRPRGLVLHQVRTDLPQGAVDGVTFHSYSAEQMSMVRIATTYVAVVDDDENTCRSFGRLLRAAGLQPVTYDSAEAFLADSKHPQFGCLVLDIQLSDISGIELAQRLAAAGQRTPIIFITAHDDPEARDAAEALGCAAYFRKTDSGKEVLEAIRRVAL